MEEMKDPAGGNVDKSLGERILEFLLKLSPIKHWARQISSFVQRVAFLPQIREQRQIENMALYLEAVSKALDELKEKGVSEDEIRALSVELAVPVIAANMKAIIFLRKADRAVGNEDSEKV